MGVAGRNDNRDLIGQAPHQSARGTGDAGCALLLQSRQQQCLWVPARRRARKTMLYEILVERGTLRSTPTPDESAVNGQRPVRVVVGAGVRC